MILVILFAVYFTCLPIPAFGKSLQKDKIEKRVQAHGQQKGKKKTLLKLQLRKNNIRVQSKTDKANKSNAGPINRSSVTDQAQQQVKTYYQYNLRGVNRSNAESPVGDFGTEKVRIERAR